MDSMKTTSFIHHYTFHINGVIKLQLCVCCVALCLLCVRQSFVSQDKIKVDTSVWERTYLNYSSVWIHRSPKMSGMQTNVVICQAFYHARSSTLGSITNETVLLRKPSGEMWRFPSLRYSLILLLFLIWLIYFGLSLSCNPACPYFFFLCIFLLCSSSLSFSARSSSADWIHEPVQSLIDESNSLRQRHGILTALLSTKLSVTGLLSSISHILITPGNSWWILRFIHILQALNQTWR